MDPGFTLHDTVRCGLFKTNIVQNYCDFCHTSLCKLCIEEHISNDYDKHKVVLFQERKSSLIFPTCKLHSNKTCHLQCKSCDALICVLCIASDEHKGHDFIVLEDIYKTKKECIEKDTEEIEKGIAPTYEEIKNELIYQIASVDRQYEKITKCMSEQGEIWHTEVDKVINNMKNEISEIKKNHRAILEKHSNEIKQIKSLIEENLLTLNNIEESNDVSKIVNYRTRLNEFRKLPPKVHVKMPTFCSKPINREHFHEMIGSLKPFVLTSHENGYKMKSQEVSFRELLDIPETVSIVKTGYRHIRSISLYSEENIWTSGKVNYIKCFNPDSKCMKIITTKSGEWPSDIAVTSGGDLVYCDF